MTNKALLDALNWRYATKVFDKTKKLDDATVTTLCESLRLSASSYGMQAWKFVIVQNPKLREALVPHSNDQHQVTDCSHFFVLCHKTDITDKDVEHYISFMAEERNIPRKDLEPFFQLISKMIKGKKKDGSFETWMAKQLYIALGTLLSACALLKVDACPMEGIDKEKYDEILDLKKFGLKTVLACPVGFRDASDKYAKLKKIRFPVEETFISIL